MSKNLIALTGLLLLFFVRAPQAHPLDSPDIVYIDGLPCNRACQSYMAWSWRRTSPAAQHSAPVEAQPVQSPPLKIAPEHPMPRAAKRTVSRAAAVHRENSRPAKGRIAKPVAPLPPAEVTPPQPAAETVVNSESAPANVAAAPSANEQAATAETRSVQEQVAAATALAEQVTAANAAPVQQSEAIGAEASVRTGAADSGDTETSASAPTKTADNRVALLMARQEVQSVSDLAGKDVAIEDRQSASSASIRAAIASAGAAEVQLDEKNTKAVDRLVGGEVPAAVVALVSREAAEWFPEIPGYRIFRIPLAPGASKARL